MKVTQVAIRPTEASDFAGRPALTPELLAASGARYSRNNEGLEAILSKVDPNNLDKSVDSIFKMIDYGHQSIADMAPVAIFIDELSIFLAYLVWSWCPTAGGQESSTRYIKLSRDGLIEPELFGLEGREQVEWYDFMGQCFDAYGSALTFWENLGSDHPQLTKIPKQLLEDQSEKAHKQVSRMRRNFAFDRARYFLPVAAKTNMMLVMSARGWVQLCQNLLSHWLPEAKLLGEAIKSELGLSAPRLVKHAEVKTSFLIGHQKEFEKLVRFASEDTNANGEAECLSSIEIFQPRGVEDQNLAQALVGHENRYDFVGSDAARTSVRFAWSAVAIAEIRDLNRHRTGSKYCPLFPVGFYCADDQLAGDSKFESRVGDSATLSARLALRHRKASFCAWLLLGTQFQFEHTTTLDKFTYEAELRTGTGAHFRYARHMRDLVTRLAQQFPHLARSIVIGSAEPE